ncbi:oxygen-dependent tRNA uridine(34) hydroxylase TrhO [Mariniluteicoccus flavus]
MAIPKVLLYYAFAPLSDPEAVRLWQHALAEGLGLTGRIIVSPHGINGTVAGDVTACKQYVKRTRAYAPFATLDVKWSEGTGDDFPRLSVKARDEIVAFGVPDEVVVDASGVVGGGRHLTPDEVHALVADRGDEVAFFDGRNAWEAEIGRFRGAVVPDVATTRDFVAELESGKYDELKDRPVVTYCTGGIRCEVLSALMVNRGFREVYQLDGGIVRYGERFGDGGLWEGTLRVFDGRERVRFSGDAAVIGQCEICGAATDHHRDCVARGCKGRALLCDDHAYAPLCPPHRRISDP